MNNLTVAINTLSAMYFMAKDKGYDQFAENIEFFLTELLIEQNRLVKTISKLENIYGKSA